MALELISSEVKPSFDPTAVILMCQWRCDGVIGYSSILVPTAAFSDPLLWSDIETAMRGFFKSKKRQAGEINELHGH